MGASDGAEGCVPRAGSLPPTPSDATLQRTPLSLANGRSTDNPAWDFHPIVTDTAGYT